MFLIDLLIYLNCNSASGMGRLQLELEIKEEYSGHACWN